MVPRARTSKESFTSFLDEYLADDFFIKDEMSVSLERTLTELRDFEQGLRDTEIDSFQDRRHLAIGTGDFDRSEFHGFLDTPRITFFLKKFPMSLEFGP